MATLTLCQHFVLSPFGSQLAAPANRAKRVQEVNKYVNLCLVHTKGVAISALRRRTLAVAQNGLHSAVEEHEE